MAYFRAKVEKSIVKQNISNDKITRIHPKVGKSWLKYDTLKERKRHSGYKSISIKIRSNIE